MAQTGATSAATAGTVSTTWRDTWDQFTANAHNAVADIGETVGDKLKSAIEDPVGSVKGALVGALDQMGPFGVGLAAIGAAAGVAGSALMELGTHAEEVGSSFAKMSMVTGGSVAGLSDLRFALDATGGSAIDLDRTFFMFQQRMENSTAKVSAGLQMIGLSLEDIKGLSADQQMLKISDAFIASSGSVNKAAAAMDLFGRQGKEILPSLMQPLSDLAQKSEEIGNTWSDTDAKAAHEFEIAVATSLASASSEWTQFGRIIAPITDDLTLAWDRMKLAVANVVMLLPNLAEEIGKIGNATAATDLATETANAHYDTIRYAWSLGAPAGIKYGDAVKYIHDNFAIGIDSSNAWVANLAAQTKAAETAKKAADDLTTGLGNLGIVIGHGIENQAEYEKAQIKAAAAVVSHRDAVNALVATFEGESKASQVTIDALVIAAKQHDLSTEAIARMEVAITKLETAGVMLPQVLYNWDEAQRQLLDSTHAFVVMGLAPANENISTELNLLKGLSTEWDGANQEFLLAATQLPQVAGGLSTVNYTVQDGKQYLLDYHTAATKVNDGLTTLANSFIKMGQAAGSSMSGIVGGIGQVIVALDALQHSGQTQNAAGTWVPMTSAQQSQQNQATALTGLVGGAALGAGADTSQGFNHAEITGMFGTSAASAASAVALGVATFGISLGVSAAVAAIKDLTGPSVTELAGRKTEAAFEQAMGGVDAMQAKIGAAYAEVGLSGDAANAAIHRLWDSEKQGAAATQDAIDAVNVVLQEAATKTAAVSTEVGDVTTAFAAAGTHIPDSMMATIKSLQTMTGLTVAEKASLAALTNVTATNFASLTTMASNYGITLSQLGPKFQQANIDASAKQIFSDFTDLTAAGGDVNGILGGMSAAVSKLVSDSIGFGTAIPDNMKPMIEAMISNKSLLDANGAAITSLTGINFEATPLDVGLTTLNDTLQTLIKTLQGPGGLNDAISGLPSSTTISIVGKYVPPIDTGGGMAPIPMASGGAFIASRPTLIMAGEGGSPEHVQVTPLGSGAGGGGIVIPVTLLIDGQTLAQVQVPLHAAELRRLGLA